MATKDCDHAPVPTLSFFSSLRKDKDHIDLSVESPPKQDRVGQAKAVLSTSLVWHHSGAASSCSKPHSPFRNRVCIPLNSQGADQLWSRMDRLHFATHYGSARYRYFLKNYCVWRNDYLRKTRQSDATPCVSRRQIRRRG